MGNIGQPNGVNPPSPTRNKVTSQKNPAKVQFIKTGPEPFVASDFCVEIGGKPEFENLPHTIHRRRDKLARKFCAACHKRRSLFRYRGKVRFDSDHNLCFRCYRSAMDRLVAIRLSKAAGERHE